MARRPASLIYAVDERPPLPALVILGLQQVSIVSVSLLIPITVAREAGVEGAALLDFISAAMLAIGVASLLQGFRLGPFGCGYLVPGFCTANYLPASIAAAQLGGLPLVWGMTLLAGGFEMLCSRLVQRLRPFFPPEISGVAVLLIGVELGTLAARRVFAMEGLPSAPVWHLGAGLVTFFLSAGLSIYGRGIWQLFSALIAIGVGYTLAHLGGLVITDGAGDWWQTPLALPRLVPPRWSFDTALVFPFLLGALACTLKTIGAVTTCQKLNDADWQRPEMGAIQRGVAADGLATVIAGLMGGYGQNSATGGIGISSATGATSRYIAVAIAGWFLLLACLPPVAAGFVLMPEAVSGGALMFSACYMVVNGIQIISSRHLDHRGTVIVGLSLILAISRAASPEFYDTLPDWLRPFTGSSLVIGLSVALVLNALLRIGVRRAVRATLPARRLHARHGWQFVQRLGQRWTARDEVIRRAGYGLGQLLETLGDGARLRGLVRIEGRFDEFHLDLRVSYDGPVLQLASEAPIPTSIVDCPDAQRQLADFLVQRLADRVVVKARGARVTIVLRFNH